MPDFSSFVNNTIGQKVSSLASNITGRIGDAVQQVNSIRGQLEGIGSQLPELEQLIVPGSARLSNLLGGSTHFQFNAPEDARAKVLGGNQVLVFPENLGNDKILFQFKQLKPSVQLAGLGKPTQIPDVSIILPIPSNLGEQFDIGYTSVDVGAFVGTNLQDLQRDLPGIIQRYDQAQTGQQAQQAGIDSIQAFVNRNVNKQTLSYGLWKFAEAMPYGREAMGALSRGMGVIPNPYPAQVFEGIGFRKFQFEWTLQPQSRRETEKLRDIIYNIKLRILPEIDKSQLWMHWPSQCSVRVTPAVHHFTDCVINSLSVNYTPNGPAFYQTEGQEGAAPVQVQLQLQLTEIELVTQETIRDFEQRNDKTKNNIANELSWDER